MCNICKFSAKLMVFGDMTKKNRQKVNIFFKVSARMLEQYMVGYHAGRV